MRSLALTLALVAMSVQAQEASTPEGEKKRAPSATAPAAEGEQSQALMASIEPAGSQRPALPPSTPAARSDAGAEAGPQQKPTDCGIQQAMLVDEDPPVAVSLYNSQTQSDRPRVSRAGRCFRKCILQLKTESKEPWVIKNARVEGPGGEVLKVTDIRSRPDADKTISVIEAERTNGPALSSKMLLTLHLVAEDGRVALLQDVELP
jgi:hypothetical protein